MTSWPRLEQQRKYRSRRFGGTGRSETRSLSGRSVTATASTFDRRSGGAMRRGSVQHRRRTKVGSGGGVEKDVTFEDANHEIDDEVDAAYRAKYRRYAGRILNSVLTPQARSTTVKLLPRSTRS